MWMYVGGHMRAQLVLNRGNNTKWTFSTTPYLEGLEGISEATRSTITNHVHTHTCTDTRSCMCTSTYRKSKNTVWAWQNYHLKVTFYVCIDNALHNTHMYTHHVSQSAITPILWVVGDFFCALPTQLKQWYASASTVPEKIQLKQS